LFGSQARGDADPESDLDILVILAHDIDPVIEIKRNNAFISDLCLEYDQLINCVYMSQQDWQTLKTPLVQNIQKEGVTL
jgi:predicted nucleotidyltransferase